MKTRRRSRRLLALMLSIVLLINSTVTSVASAEWQRPFSLQEIEQLTTDEIEALTADQIATLTNDHFQTMTLEQLRAFTVEQLEGMETIQYRWYREALYELIDQDDGDIGEDGDAGEDISPGDNADHADKEDTADKSDTAYKSETDDKSGTEDRSTSKKNNEKGLEADADGGVTEKKADDQSKNTSDTITFSEEELADLDKELGLEDLGLEDLEDLDNIDNLDLDEDFDELEDSEDSEDADDTDDLEAEDSTTETSTTEASTTKEDTTEAASTTESDAAAAEDSTPMEEFILERDEKVEAQKMLSQNNSNAAPGYNITVNHYDDTSTAADKRIYTSDTANVDPTASLYPVKKAVNWDIVRVEVTPAGGGAKTTYYPASSGQTSKLTDKTDPQTGAVTTYVSITQDCTVDVYYQKKAPVPYDGGVDFYDYTVKAGTGPAPSTGGTAKSWVTMYGSAWEYFRMWVTQSGDGYSGNACWRNGRLEQNWDGGGAAISGVVESDGDWVYGNGHGNSNESDGKEIRINTKTGEVQKKNVLTYSIDMYDGYESHWDKGSVSTDGGDALTVGKPGQYDYQLAIYVPEYKVDKDWNKWTGSAAPYTNPPLLSGLDSSGYPQFAYNSPQFFNNTDWVENGYYLRKHYDDLNLRFTQTGDDYVMENAWEGTTYSSVAVTATAGSQFYPLDLKSTGVNPAKIGQGAQPDSSSTRTACDATIADTYDEVNLSATDNVNSDGLHNFFFGMRYDITFELGDYCGPLTYSFSGDDDLWVVLSALDDNGNVDTKKQAIVMDLGGIHSPTQKITTDLWTYLESNTFGVSRYASADPDNDNDPKNTTYQLTVLYMERGANFSNCYMEFTIPNAMMKNDSNPVTEFHILKTSEETKQVLGDAEFQLTGISGGAVGYNRIEKTSSANGKILFTDLKSGSYHLVEKQAPEGYAKITGEWLVRVGTTTANGVQTVRVYSIKDQNSKELVGSPYWNDPVLNIENEPAQKIVKVFKGLDATEIATMVQTPKYEVTVKKTIDGVEKTWTLKLDDSKCVKTIPSGTTDEFVYTWTLDGIPAEGTYKVSEDNEEYSPLTVSRTLESNSTNKTTNWSGNETTIAIQDGDVITLTNTYVNPTKTRIKVAKTFIGLPQTEIDKLTSFTMDLYRVKKSGETKDVHIKTLTLAATSYTDKYTDANGDIVYTWEIPNIDTGEYYVTETNYDTLSTFKHKVKTGDGSANKVDVSQPNWQLDYNATVETTCSSTQWNMINKLVIAKAGDSSTSKIVYIFTEEVLSTSQQKSIEDYISKNLVQFDRGNDTQFIYYSKGEGVTVKGKKANSTITWQGDDLIFGSTDTWQMFTYDNYSWKGAQAGDLHVKNTYALNGIVLDIKKYGTAYPDQSSIPEKTGSSFTITRGTWAKNTTSGKMEFTKTMNSTNTGFDWTETFDPSTKSPEYGLVDLVTPTNSTDKLEAGDYILEEKTAPSGYSLLTAPIYLRVENGEAKLVDSQGAALTPDANGITEETMWRLEGDINTGYILRIKNEILYDLPSTGGAGVYRFIICGVIFMTAAAAIMMYSRRREYE